MLTLTFADIKADNILQDIVDERILEAFAKAEIAAPSPRKFVDNSPIYASRTFGLPRRFGGPVLGDFGAAVRGDVKRNHDAQPAVYRAPEVMLKAEWSYPVDIWNVGVMVSYVFVVLQMHMQANVTTRSGTYFKADTCSAGVTPMTKITRPAHTWLK